MQNHCFAIKLRAHGGGGGIRTLEELAPLTVFKTVPFNHSGTPPRNRLTMPSLYYKVYKLILNIYYFLYLIFIDHLGNPFICKHDISNITISKSPLNHNGTPKLSIYLDNEINRIPY